MKKAIHTVLIILTALFSSAQNDTISDINVVQRTDGSGLVDISFSVSGPDSSYNISLEVSLDGGNIFSQVPPAFLSGDIMNITPGENKQIVWDGVGSFPDTNSTQTVLKIVAEKGAYCPASLTDADGNVYSMVVIGTQCWMAENLETTKYKNGSPIDYPGADNNGWQNNTSGAYGWYGNDNYWKDSYGALYNWHAVMNSNGLCPSGWHVPTRDEWTVLIDFLGGEYAAGGKMKSTRTDPDPHPRWDSPNSGATNESNWSGLPGGYREHNGDFAELGLTGIWWTSTEIDGILAWSLFVINSSPSITLNNDFFKTYGLSVRCIWEEGPQTTLPSVTTAEVTDITQTTALCGGNVTGDGGADVTARGIVWATFENPTIEAHGGMTSDGTGTGEFASYMSGLTQGTEYFVRAYATNELGTAYGGQEEFVTEVAGCGTYTVSDANGNVYNTVLIGSQCWMAENLKTTLYKNGEPIDYPGTDNMAWWNNTTGAYAWYENDMAWKDHYGALYNFHAVQNTNGLCPAGWNVPSDAEWTVLSDYLGGEAVAGGKLKSTRTDPDPHPRWEYPNIGATNESNWTGYPGGIRDYMGYYGEMGIWGRFWSSTEAGYDAAWSRSLLYEDQNISRNSDVFPGYGLSVRCLED
jgi:uncharacterized protein (TIGR02145 family)